MIKNKKYLIIGFGITGLSVIRFLYRNINNLSIAAIDTREVPPNLSEIKNKYPEVVIHFGAKLESYKEVVYSSDCIVVSPGFDLDNPIIVAAKQKGIKVIGDIELFASNVNSPVIGITGSNGKSTVTDLLGLMANKCGICVGVGGNLGTPALDLLDLENKLYILELSSFQLDNLSSLKLKVGACLNITPDHLDRHKTFNNYKNAKHNIYRLSESIVFNLDDKNTHVNRSDYSDYKYKDFFSLNNVNGLGFHIKFYDNGFYIYKNKTMVLDVSKLKIIGTHNIANVIAALTVGEIAGLPLESSIEAILEYTGLEHRCELVSKQGGVTWVNDSKSTNVGSSIAAINGLGKMVPGKLIVILGGDDKGAEYSDLEAPLIEYAKTVILIGKTAKNIQAVLNGANAPPIYHCKTLAEVVSMAYSLADTGDCILFSPACASFDMFKNFSDRGMLFKDAIKAFRIKV